MLFEEVHQHLLKGLSHVSHHGVDVQVSRVDPQRRCDLNHIVPADETLIQRFLGLRLLVIQVGVTFHHRDFLHDDVFDQRGELPMGGNAVVFLQERTSERRARVTHTEQEHQCRWV